MVNNRIIWFTMTLLACGGLDHAELSETSAKISIFTMDADLLGAIDVSFEGVEASGRIGRESGMHGSRECERPGGFTVSLPFGTSNLTGSSQRGFAWKRELEINGPGCVEVELGIKNIVSPLYAFMVGDEVFLPAAGAVGEVIYGEVRGIVSWEEFRILSEIADTGDQEGSREMLGVFARERRAVLFAMPPGIYDFNFSFATGHTEIRTMRLWEKGVGWSYFTPF